MNSIKQTESPEGTGESVALDAAARAESVLPTEPLLDATTPPAAPDPHFLIVGIGASAGGLEALDQFFRAVPPNSGLAFVVVQHLDPSHSSLLSEILQRGTAMPVLEAEDQMPVEADHVIIIPPNRDMAIFHGSLQLSEPNLPRGQRLPIDAFFRSLAEDQGERAVGIILSGTGSDGTLGLRAILGAGGMTLVQEPSSAKYDGMPSHAIQAGYATQVLPVEKMPAALIASAHPLFERSLFLRSSERPLPARLPAMPAPALLPPAFVGGMNRLLMLLRSATGHDFSLYKKSTISRRIERCMVQHEITDIELYNRYLKENPAELQVLFKELLINVTSFFRDPEAFIALKQDILPQLLKNKAEDSAFRVWVAGCASGEEAYSIAILLREWMDLSGQDFKVQLYATDLDDDAIATARAGLYPLNIAADVTPERLRRFFNKEDSGYRVKKELREMIVFALQNVIKDPPFTKLDLLSCRNLMIYLEPELQNRLIPTFHYALKPSGILFLSPSESIGSHPQLFTAINRKWKFYRAVHDGAGALTPFIALTSNLNEVAMANSQVLGAETQKASQEGTEMRRLHPVRPLADSAQQGLLLVRFQDVASQVAQAVASAVDQAFAHNIGKLTVPPLADSPCASGPDDMGRIECLERELASAQENLQATIEEQQASNEELKSGNEELQSTNEELQSTNEELETSKEELQSLNEELITVNAELQSKIEQLDGMQNDMKNLFDNIHIATLFLDQHLLIRRFTRQMTQIYRLAATDIGRPLADIKSYLEGEDLLRFAQGVLDTLAPWEREMRTTSGTWYLARIQPYRTLNNVIDGVVLTFTDITQRLSAVATQLARELAEAIVDSVREPLIVLDEYLQIVSASRSFYRKFQALPAETVGRKINDLGNGQWNIPSLKALLEDILPHNQEFNDYAVEHDFPNIGQRKLILNARPIVSKLGTPSLILLSMREVH